MSAKRAGCRVRSRLLFAAIIVAINVGGILPGATQQLPSGGGPMPELRRGANGELKVVAPPDSGPVSTRPKTSPVGPSTAGSRLPRVPGRSLGVSHPRCQGKCVEYVGETGDEIRRA